MKTLEEYNQEKRKQYSRAPKGNDIACPKCSGEMQDVGGLLTSYPPQQKVKCPKCLYDDYRIA